MLKLNGEEVIFGQFPNKEFNLPIKRLQFLMKPSPQENYVTWIFTDNDDFAKLLILTHWLKEMSVCKVINVSYMPYSRMDRANGVYVPSLEPILDFVCNLNYDKVTVREPHSAITMNRFGWKQEDWCLSVLINILKDNDLNSLCFPDKGAEIRYSNCTEHFLSSYGVKSRDFTSGNIETYSLKGEVGNRVLIVDDLCSRGGTFVRSSKFLKERGAKSVSLLVSYLEANVLTGEMFNYIDTIYTHKDWEATVGQHPRIKYID